MRKFKKYLVPNPIHHNIPDMGQLKKPLNIEIGCGVGRHPILWAGQNPDKHIIALEKSPMRFAKFSQTLQSVNNVNSVDKKTYSNITPIQSNAISFISHHVEPSSVETYFLLYPNPYPKQRQANKRWHNMPFMQVLFDTLMDKGTLVLASNMQFYIEEAKDVLTQNYDFKIEKEDIYHFPKVPKVYRTHFEEKYLLTGQSCYNVVFRK